MEDHGDHVHAEGGTQEPAQEGGAEPATAPTEAEISGIGSSVAVGRFVTAAKEVQSNWGELAPEARADGLATAANAELSAVGVPETANELEDLGHQNGHLSFTTWTLTLGEQVFSEPTIDDAKAAAVADTVYHESRHAEQWHRMARHMAGTGQEAAAIARAMAIPARIATDAAANPISGDSTEANEAEAWYENVYGSGRDARGEVLRGLRTLRATLDEKREALRIAEAAYKAVEDDDSVEADEKTRLLEAWQAAFAAWETARDAQQANYDRYRALAEEADAWAVGDAVSSAYSAS